MNSSEADLNDSDESDIAEKSPDGRYIRYNELLNTRGRSLVYKGFDGDNGVEVDWNKVSADGYSLKSLEEAIDSEVQLLKSLKHRSIIKFHSSWVDRSTNTVNLITESFSSGSLREYLQKHKGIDSNAVKNWAKQILQGLKYLHAHDPPIIHGDLSCDNLFVNGNTGEVKIGELGIATIQFKSLLGLHEEKYDQVVDVYSFGLCMLELATRERPFNGCRTRSEFYTKAALGTLICRVKDPSARKFIERCLVPVSVEELLEDPFLFSNSTKSPCGSTSDLPFSSLELRRSNGKRAFRLKGERTDDYKSISLTLWMVELCGDEVKKIEFLFDLDADTTLSVAAEMVEQLDMSSEDVSLVAELMDSLIVKLAPYWIPSSFLNYSGGVKCPPGDPILVF